MSAYLWASLAIRGRCSVTRTPGTELGIGLNSPRISEGAVGLGSNVSNWLGPPNWNNIMTLRAVALRFDVASARSRLGRLNPAIPRPPIVSAVRRLIRERRKSAQQEARSPAICPFLR